MEFILSCGCVNMVCLSVLIHISGAPVIPAYVMNFGIYHHDAAFDDRLPTEVTQWTPADSDLQCGRQCQEETWCNSLFYNHDTRSCALQRMVYVSLSSDQTSSVQGWSYYRLTSARCPAKSGYVIDRLTATCYRLVTSLLPSWFAARAACNASDEMLVVLQPVEKAQFVLDFLSTNIALHDYKAGIFTGGSRPLEEWDTPIPPEGLSFVWLNGQPVNLNATQAFWKSLSGRLWKDPSRNIVVIRRDHGYLWTPGFSQYDRFYICERSYL